MKGLSVKSKIFLVVVTLSVVTLTTFGYLAYSTYNKDKLAFIYDYLTSEVQSKSSMLTSSIGTYDLLLGSIITSFDPKTKGVPSAASRYLEGTPGVMGVYLHAPIDNESPDHVLYEIPENTFKIDFKQLNIAKMGPTLLDANKGAFIFKKPLSRPGSYAVIAFASLELADLFSSFNGRHSLLLSGSKVESRGKKTIALSNDELSNITLKIDSLKTPYGLFEVNILETPYFVSFSKLPYSGKVLVNMIEVKKVMLVQEVFLYQLLIFLFLMTSISMLIGTISARWLTWHLDNLTAAAHEMENENFDINVEVTSNDELGKLGFAFNSMCFKIKNLLEELRIYNLELENKVAERTAELQHLSNIQRAMLNSLGQGFVLVDKSFSVQPVYSKIAVDMFEAIPDKVPPTKIMGADEQNASNFKDLFELMTAEALDFDDMVKLFPEFVSNSKSQQIQLTYTPIRNEESSSLDYMMVIGTDKTAEIESMKKFQKEWDFSQMIMKVASNRFSLIKLINESKEMLSSAQHILKHKEPFAFMNVQRLVHTIKGSFSFYHITEVTGLCHELESDLTAYLKIEKIDDAKAKEIGARVDHIQEAVSRYIASFESILRMKEASVNKTIPVTTLKSFETLLSSRAPELQAAFVDNFYTVKVGPYFETYPSMVKDLCVKLNKDVKFILEGGDTMVPENRVWDEIFQQFVHVIRNSMDHGIESKGTITFSFEHPAGSQLLRATLKDSGRGVDWKKIAAKDPSVKTEQQALEKIILGGISSKDEVSEFSGRGVGVSSLYACVIKNGGDIKIVNELGKGLTLIVEMPFPGKARLELAA